MKKSLVMAMAMAMGVTASAYAANPFSDVPAGHWAYDAVAQLAAAGVVDGYGTTFGGEKLMTRYEMAQIVAKAMAKGGNCDKLAAEFADELDALGVRVAKLEKKVDNVKITGQIRYDYRNDDGNDNTRSNNYGGFRTRLWVNGQINDNWSYTGMLQNHRKMHGNNDDLDGDTISLKRAYLEGRVGGVKVLAGHWNEFFINDTILDDFVDGVYGEYGVGNGKVYGIIGRNTGSTNTWQSNPLKDRYHPQKDEDRSRLYVAGISQKFGAVNAALNFFKADADSGDNRKIYNINLDWAIDKNWGLTGRYMRASDDVFKTAKYDVGKNGFFAQLNYKAADSKKAGTWGARARYFNQPANTFLFPTYDLNCFRYDGGYKGWAIGADYVLAKNIMLTSDYYAIKSKENDKKDNTWYTQLFFMF